MKKLHHALFIALFLALSLVPSAGMVFQKGTTAKEEGLPLPKPYSEEGWNRNFLSDSGSWFEKNFTFRDQLLTANSYLSGLTGSSPVDAVIVGRDGWLFYADSLKDYQKTDLLSDRALFDMAHTLSLTQQYLQQTGVQLLYVIAPNKNSLYGRYMPRYTQAAAADKGNYENLMPFLEQEDVLHTDLKGLLQKEIEADPDTLLYHKGDSHWNYLGAAIAAGAILDDLQGDHVPYETMPSHMEDGFVCDLKEMLYPAGDPSEPEVVFDSMPEFTYLSDVKSNFDFHIYTAGNDTSFGSLVMYRDSFSNALLPFLAESFAAAHFTRAAPYDLSDVDEIYADTVIIEQAERFLPVMAEQPPKFPAMLTLQQNLAELPEDAVSGLTLEPENGLIRLSGTIRTDALQTDSRIFVETPERNLYEACPVHRQDGTEGFVMYLPEAETVEPKGCRILLDS